MTRQYNSEELAVIIPKAIELNSLIERTSGNEDFSVNKRQFEQLISFFRDQEQKSRFLNYSNQDIDTPLITAAAMLKRPWVQLLLDYGADKNAVNSDNEKVFDILDREMSKPDVTDAEKLQEMRDFISNYRPSIRVRGVDHLSANEIPPVGRNPR